jgi:membrane dipeptidase
MSNNHYHSPDPERAPLLSTRAAGHDGSPNSARPSNLKVRATIWGLLTLLFVVALVLLVGFEKVFGDALAPYLGTLPSDPYLAALAILDKAPVIVGFTLLLPSDK